MKTFTASVQNDEDAELLKKVLDSTHFKGEIETHEEENEFTEEDIAEFDRRMADYDQNPSSRIPLDDFMKSIKDKYGV